MPKNEISGGHSLKEEGLYSGISKDKYREMVFKALDNTNGMSRNDRTAEDIDAEYDKFTDDELARAYDRILDEHPTIWRDKTLEDKSVPIWVYNTGDPAVLNEYLKENADAMTYEQQHIVKQSIAATEKRAGLQLGAALKTRNGEPLYDEPEIEYEDRPNGDYAVSLKNVTQKEFQNTNKGCWANFFQVLASGKGVDITQDDIKNYRPMISREEAEKTDKETHKSYNTDNDNSAMEMADSLLAFVPNTMLREVEIAPYGAEAEKAGISKEQYLENAVRELCGIIKPAVLNDRSPVGLLAGNHYITITGIDGDRVKFKNSVPYEEDNTDPDKEYVEPLEDLVRNRLIAGNEKIPEGVQITWLADIQLAKDGRNIFGVPSEYVTMKENGELTEQPDAIKTGAKNTGGMQTNRIGMLVSRYGGREDTASEQNYRSVFTNGVIKYEKAYLPKKLDAEYLRKRAEKRDPAVENAMRELDNELLGRAFTKYDISKDLDNAAAPEMKSFDEVRRGNIGTGRTQYMDDYDSGARASRSRSRILSSLEQTAAEKREVRAGEDIERDRELSRLRALYNGFDEIKTGKHPEIMDFDFMYPGELDPDSIDGEDLVRAENVMREVFGVDNNGSHVTDLGSVLERFTYKTTPDGEPVDLVEDVRARLAKSEKFKGRESIKDEEVYPYAKAELLRQTVREGSGLTFHDSNGKPEAGLKDIYARPDPSADRAASKIRDIRTGGSMKRLYHEIQEMRLKAVRPDNIGGSLLNRSEKDIDTLARTYDYIFGGIKNRELGKHKILVSTEGDPVLKDLDEVYKEQYKGKKQSPAQAEKFKKAMLVNALASGIGVGYGRAVLPELTSLAFGKGTDFDLRKNAVDQILDDKQNFSGEKLEGHMNVALSFGVKDMGNVLSEMNSDMEANAGNVKEKTPHYQRMKKEVGELNKMVNETWKAKTEAGEPVTFDMMNEFFEKSDKVRASIRGYLEHKKGELIGGASRSKDPDSPEQKHIRTAINSLRTLDRVTKSIEEGVLKGISRKARDYFKQDQRELEDIRKGLGANELTECEKNAARLVDRQTQLEEGTYTRQSRGGKKESLTEARERLLRNVDKSYDTKEMKRLGKNGALRSAVDAVKDSLAGGKNLPNKNIINTYNIINNSVKRADPAPDREKYEADRYADELLSRDKLTLHQKSGENASIVPATQEKGIEKLDNLFGFEPVMKPEYYSRLSDKQKQDMVMSRKALTDVPHDFKPVYRGKETLPDTERLSEKDFAALAVAGARQQVSYDMKTKRAALKARLDGEKITKEDYETMRTVMDGGLSANDSRISSANDYTYALGHKKFGDEFGKQYCPVIQNGRKLASEAMRAYEEGDLIPLAKLIANEVKETVAACKGSEDHSDFPVAGEYAKRLCNMLERDDKLKAEAKKQGLGQKDIDTVDSIITLGMANEKSKHSAKLWEKRADLMTDDVRHEVMADMYISNVMEDQLHDIERNKLQSDPAFANELKQAKDKYENVKNDGTKSLDQEKAAKLSAENLPSVMMKRTKFKYPLFEKIGRTGAYDALRSETVNMMKSTDLGTIRDRGKFLQATDRIRSVKQDTGKTSTLRCLREYRNEPKNEKGHYRLKYFDKGNDILENIAPKAVQPVKQTEQPAKEAEQPVKKAVKKGADKPLNKSAKKTAKKTVKKTVKVPGASVGKK